MKSVAAIIAVFFSLGNLYSQTTTFEKSYGTLQNLETGKFLIEFSDQIYFAGSLTASYILLYELNSTGDTIFTKSLPGEFDIEMPLKVVNTGDGFVIAATKIGAVNSLFLVKLNENIDTVWTKTFERFEHYRVMDVVLASDGGFLSMGYNDLGDQFIRLLKVDQSGNFLWSMDNEIGTMGLPPYGLSLENASTYGYFFSASYYYGRLDNAGNLLWVQHITGLKSLDLKSVDEASFIISSWNYIIKIDTNAQIIWQQPLFNYTAKAVEYKAGSGIYTIEEAATSNSSVPDYYSHYDENGFMVWTYQSAGECESISLSSDNGLLIAGNFSDDTWFLKTDLDGKFKDIFITNPYAGELLSTNLEYKIKWSSAYTTNLKLEYSTNGGISWQITAFDIPADSQYFNWLIPLLVSDSAFIRLTDQSDASISDENNYSIRFSPNNSVEYIDANEVKMWVGNYGQGSYNPFTDGWGFYWPASLQDTTLTAIFEDGLVYGAKVAREIRVNGDTYRWGLQPGRIIETGAADDPLKNVYTIWKVDKNWPSLPPGSERDRYEYNYDNWPVDLGAPFNDKDGDGEYTPGLDQPYIGDQTLFNVMNDLNPVMTEYTYGSQPIGLEVQSSIFGLNREDELKNVVFKKYKIINKSDTNLEDMFLSYWADDDLGYASDDFVGCDSILSLAYQYNGDNIDQGFYETPPPAVGHKLVQGPIVPASDSDSAMFNGKWIKGFKNLPMTSFVLYLSSVSPYIDPDIGVQQGSIQFYNNMNGLFGDGSPVIDPNTGLETKYSLSGDPVFGEGWYEGDGWDGGPELGDRRYVLSSGPFNLAIGDTQEIVIAIMMAQGSDNINSISKLKNTAVMVQNFYESNFTVTDVKGKDIKAPYEFALFQNYPNPFNPSTKISWQSPVGSWQTLKIYDVLGNEVVTLVNEYKPAGNYQIEWDARNFASGVYFYRLNAGAYVETKKLILLK